MIIRYLKFVGGRKIERVLFGIIFNREEIKDGSKRIYEKIQQKVLSRT